MLKRLKCSTRRSKYICMWVCINWANTYKARGKKMRRYGVTYTSKYSLFECSGTENLMYWWMLCVCVFSLVLFRNFCLFFFRCARLNFVSFRCLHEMCSFGIILPIRNHPSIVKREKSQKPKITHKTQNFYTDLKVHSVSLSLFLRLCVGAKGKKVRSVLSVTVVPQKR